MSFFARRQAQPHSSDAANRPATSDPATAAASQGPEPWVTKRRLAKHLEVTTRWIEMQQRLGLPHLHMGGMNRYRISEVEAWLRECYGANRHEAA